MRKTSTITDIKGNSNGTLFLDNCSGELWYVSVSGDVEMVAPGGVKQFDVGETHAAVLMQDGSVFTFYTYIVPGVNMPTWAWRGQFAVGEKPDNLNGLMDAGLAGVSKVVCGDNFTMALDGDGLLHAAGDNSSGVFGNGSYSQAQRAGVFQAVQRDITDVTAGNDWSFMMRNDGVLYKTGSNNRYECGGRISGATREEPCLLTPAGINVSKISTAQGRSVAVEKNGTVWHTGYGTERDRWPDNYHFKRRECWEIVPELRLRDVIVGNKCETIAIDAHGDVLACGTGNTRKFGQWYSGTGNLFGNKMRGEQIALTPGASFVKNGGEWFSAYEKNPHAGLSCRPDQSSWSYGLMLHPHDWLQVSHLRSMGISDDDAVMAAVALS